MKTIPLNDGSEAIVDDFTHKFLSYFTWRNVNGYAVRSRIDGADPPDAKQTISMHRDLMNNPPEEIDHINGNTLDNRYENLRLATRSQNAQNRRRKKNKDLPKGVTLDRATGKYCAKITCDKKTQVIGYYATAEEAHLMYKMKAMELHGEFYRFD